MEWEELEAIERGCNQETCLKDVAIVQEELVGTHSEAVRWRGGEKKKLDSLLRCSQWYPRAQYNIYTY